MLDLEVINIWFFNRLKEVKQMGSPIGLCEKIIFLFIFISVQTSQVPVMLPIFKQSSNHTEYNNNQHYNETNSQLNSKKVIGGFSTRIKKYPFFVLLLSYKKMVISNEIRIALSRCTGTHIAAEWVLTSAHCLIDGTKIIAEQVHLYWNVQSLDRIVLQAYPQMDTLDPDIAVASKIVIHHEYRRTRNYSYDIAMVKLPRKYRRTKYISLPEKDDHEKYKKGTKLTALGYDISVNAHLYPNGSFPRNHLKKVETRILDYSECKMYSRGIEELRFCHVSLKGYRRTDSGDSGGPCYVKAGRNKILIGVTKGHFPSLFPPPRDWKRDEVMRYMTAISTLGHLEWIKEVMGGYTNPGENAV